MSSGAKITDTGRKGDLRIGFGFERGRFDVEPAMYIYSARSPLLVACLPIRLMYLFDTRPGEAEKELSGEYKALANARDVAKSVYDTENPSDMEARRVLSAIEDFMNDLKNMPPPSTWRNPETLELALKARGYDFVNDGVGGIIDTSMVH